jgi:hypothetical protein
MTKFRVQVALLCASVLWTLGVAAAVSATQSRTKAEFEAELKRAESLVNKIQNVLYQLPERERRNPMIKDRFGNGAPMNALRGRLDDGMGRARHEAQGGTEEDYRRALNDLRQANDGVSRELQNTIDLLDGMDREWARRYKYEYVSRNVMSRVFSSGRLDPDSPAVRHAADVDMPAHGSTLDSLYAYLQSQNGAVRKWYCDNYGLR